MCHIILLFLLKLIALSFSRMEQVLQLLKGKGEKLDCVQFKNIIRIGYSHASDDDLNPLMDIHVPNKNILSRKQYIQALYTISAELARIQFKGYPISLFNLTSQVKMEQNQIQSICLQALPEVQDFKDVLGEEFYKKLIFYGSNSILSQKIQQFPHKSYSFFHWIQNKIDFAVNYESENLYLQLLKQVWYFKYEQTQGTLEKIKITYPKDQEISSIQIGLKYIRQIYKKIIENQELKEVFIDRKQFQIKFQSSSSNNTQVKDFNQQIRQIKEQLVFIANYFNHIKKEIKNKFYYGIAAFLANKEDNYVKYNDQIIGISQISITDRFLYAKKFYRPEDFQNLKSQILETIHNISEIDYITLFGTRKQSEIILQNYLNETNNIQKAAFISVILKLLIEQGKFGLKDSKIEFYDRIIKSYEMLLNSKDLGISRHKFDQKCTNIQVQRKKRLTNKTFNFNCIKCKNSQCLRSISKRIAIDFKQSQIKMKGYTCFSKDQKSQIMYCIDCKEILPKCCVCLIPVTVYNGYAQEIRKNSTSEKKIKNCGQSLGSAIVWCPKCFHGGHFSHMMKWGQRAQKKCPVYSCQCKCQWDE